ncbi:TPA: rhodanese-like domain-containing protein [Legionella pneumophila subsp. pneumophila]|uniref:rhodanese-like domain-containing protein n=1 Tax=Legionella pneumophila TaxID=446 RepID=UPI0001527826|nr:rhodanese-like domain-containing protein [Legionella pneumophila]HAT8850093.1 rhodanese-like domain-containing protein [Legionella pneumophila subsp. pneumophila]ABQ55704.1 rhodanese domain protein [Legionella pneumophila str. Corby]ADG25642.1 Rhodanese sulfurtransferase like protein [Legionella pneumophila 2300/99 Alcoy]MCK1856964.1 rhodanese-like domain-containing protein [Legionella pneumophila]MCW8403161.1 rhodanese-like domain-containing protein [Legionella pneumophila]
MEKLGQFIINHWQLWLAFVVVVFLIFINEILSQRKKAKEVSPQSLVDLMNNGNAIVIDIRDKESFKNGHIINSMNVNPDDFDQQKMSKYKDKPIILVCARGLQSPTLAMKIRNQGYQPLVLSGGIQAWQGADLPLVKGK